mgnify:CR=1 FL=1
MQLSGLPLFERLGDSQRILIAGAGGGFDVFAGLPLYFALKAAGREVFLANLSFSDLRGADELVPGLYRVDALSDGGSYFPEKYLSSWFDTRGETVPVYGFDKTGVVPYRAAYEHLVERLDLDALVLVDGGTDSLMRGDEAGLGTPVEDMATVAATRGLELPTKLLVCLGFGVDTFHGVCHAQFLEAVAAIGRAGGYLGAFSVLPEMPESALYLEALEYVHRLMPQMSIVNSSVASAIEHEFGDHHRTERTRGSVLWINPLMALYFAFELGPVADRVLYLDQLMETQTMFEIAARIEAFRHTVEIKPREPIPV